ncbi:hypothetical protein [Methylohalobius crimeensis]|uniref:hypothetical protein n=1 Tax=Methylohalobius crimeensis TaxID=244365 RepID=UPI0003B3A8FC|nr:hypothetical protein [Methylohalobius crimeensis]
MQNLDTIKLVIRRRGLIWLGLILMLAGCGTGRHITATIHEDPTWIIRLQRVPGANQGQGYTHPADLEVGTLEKMLAGVLIRTGSANPEKALAPVFTDYERKRLAPLLLQGLREAGKFDVVTFVRVQPVSSWQEKLTSGGVLVEGKKIHFLLGNFQVKQALKQDLEQYDPPIELLPLEPVEKVPSGLVFRPQAALAPAEPIAEDFHKVLWLSPWHIAVFYTKL